jgi:N-acyl-phosphatidylethanolamine-hydrolysing phospholipase D
MTMDEKVVSLNGEYNQRLIDRREFLKRLSVFVGAAAVSNSLLVSCAHNRIPFDEARLLNEVESQTRESLYAPHFADGKYFNPWKPMGDRRFIRYIEWMLPTETTFTKEEKNCRCGFIPSLKERIKSMPEGDFIAWIGHCTFLIRLKGQYILTDPIFSDRAFIPKRVSPPAMTADEVNEVAPKLNILLSHNHYDHLDVESMEDLSETARVFVPMGLKDTVEDMYKKDVTEMDWWQTADLGNGIEIVALPAQHWSRRLTQGHNTTLWVSYLIKTPDFSIYFGGDSGYYAGYKEFGKVFPNIRYALLSSGAQQPRGFLHYAHMNVSDSLMAFDDLGADCFIPMHWGAFPLGDEPVGFTSIELRRQIKERNLDPSRYMILDLGQIIPIKETATNAVRPRQSYHTPNPNAYRPSAFVR